MSGADGLPVLAELRALTAEPGDRIALGDLVDRLGLHGFPLVILGLGLIALVPGPPFYPTWIGIVVVVTGWQMLAGRPLPALPGFVRRVAVPRARLRQAVERASPWLLPPTGLRRPLGGERRLVAGVLLLLGVILCLPFPFGTVLPSFALLALAGGLLREDRRLLLIGGGIAAAALAVTVSVVVFLALAMTWAVG